MPELSSPKIDESFLDKKFKKFERRYGITEHERYVMRGYLDALVETNQISRKLYKSYLKNNLFW